MECELSRSKRIFENLEQELKLALIFWGKRGAALFPLKVGNFTGPAASLEWRLLAG